jgi:formate dehydrogenase
VRFGFGNALVGTSSALQYREQNGAGGEIVISQPFWPAYLTAARIAQAPHFKLAITAGIGSDHVDLQAASEKGITVAEVTYSNSISVSEHVFMLILSLVRNYIPSYQTVVNQGWNIADCVARSYDFEGMHVGTVAAGRIGTAVLRRLKPFDVNLHYTDRHRLPAEVERELGVTFHADVESMVRVCDVVTINAPLHPETEHMFNDALIAKMKRGAYLVNTARGKICDRDAVVRALESGHELRVKRSAEGVSAGRSLIPTTTAWPSP